MRSRALSRPPPPEAAGASPSRPAGAADGAPPESYGALSGELSARAVRHTGWNLAGILLPLAVGLVTIPVLTHQLGAARFGVLGLAWMLLEYLSLFDAGLGRATIRAVAGSRELLMRRAVPGRRDISPAARSLSGTVTGAVLVQVTLGVAGGLALWAAAPLLLERLLRVPSDMGAEAVGALRILGATVPVLMLGLALRGLLEAAERFDLSNGIRIPMSVGTFVLPAVVAAAGGGLPAILTALLVLRVVSVAVQLMALERALPGLRWGWPREWQGVRELLAFGGWVAVSNAVSPVLVYVDRLVVGFLLGAAALGYYTAPFEASLRLLVLPAALVTALYPMASGLMAAGDMDRMRELYVGALRALAGGMVGMSVTGAVLAPELLTTWLGPEYAAEGSVALRLLCVGVLVNALVHVPFSFVQAAGRPDIMARFHLLELAVHLPLAFWMVRSFGVAGAAGAWLLRASLDAVLVFAAAGGVLGVGLGRLADGRLLRAALLAALLVAALLGLRVTVGGAVGWTAGRTGALAVVVLALPLVAAHAIVSWAWLLRPDERRAIVRIVLRRRPANG